MPELDFKGKEFVRNHHLTVPFRPLEPHAEKSVGEPNLDGNLIIHGDNLEALKALLPKYAGKVDCIFIDPPYNTGNEGWCYNDNVNSPLLRAWFSENPVGVDDGLRHDKWCCMMWPRLKLLKELLSEGGTIWATIDDTEVGHLRSLFDEVFETFVGQVVWEHSVQPKGYTNKFSVHHNHLLCYAKGAVQLQGTERTDEDNVNYSNPDADPKGDWRTGDLRNALYRPNLKYDLITPSGKKIQPPENGWRYKLDTMLQKIKDGEILFDPSETKVYRKIYLSQQDSRAVQTIWPSIEVGSSRDATSLLKDIFGGQSPFPTPKPLRLIERILSVMDMEPQIVLDSFAGSGTTAHAVLKMNAQDGGNRKFILVECEDYADTLTAERVRRVINGYPFQGTQRETLYEKKLTWTEVKKGDTLVQDADDRRKFAEQSGDWDKVGIKVEDGVLKVIGERKVEETAPGLGGTFTYCTLGEPLRLRALLEGDRLPSREALGDWLLYVSGAAAQSEPAPQMSEDLQRLFLGKRGGICYWLIYEPSLEVLRRSALTLDLARAIGATDRNVEHRVFGPQKFVGNKLLRAENLRIEFAQIPYALFRAGAE